MRNPKSQNSKSQKNPKFQWEKFQRARAAAGPAPMAFFGIWNFVIWDFFGIWDFGIWNFGT
jgi:hypothetical protein